MKPSSFPLTTIVLLFIAAPLVYLAIVWNHIPAIVPIHYNARLQPDKLAEKSQLWIPACVLAAAALLAYTVLKNIHKIDPMRFAGTSPSNFTRLGFVMAVFISVLNLMLMITSVSSGHGPVKLLLPAAGLLLALIGNYLPALKPNYFAGIRLPWTLHSESNWRQTHQLAGKLWFWGGLGFAVVSLFLPPPITGRVLLATIIVLTAIPSIYSYRLFQKEKKDL